MKQDIIPGINGDVYIPYTKRTGNESIVYFTRDLSAAGLIKAYDCISACLKGKVGINSKR